MFLITCSYSIFAFVLVCSAVRESLQKVSQVRDSYQWVLNIPNQNLRMTFQEVNQALQYSALQKQVFTLC